LAAKFDHYTAKIQILEASITTVIETGRYWAIPCQSGQLTGQDWVSILVKWILVKTYLVKLGLPVLPPARPSGHHDPLTTIELDPIRYDI
jgi:hypothetical protein